METWNRSSSPLPEIIRSSAPSPSLLEPDREFLFQQLEDILTALNLCDTDIKGIKSLVINKVKNKENEEKASILQRSQNIACYPAITKFILGWVARYRYRKLKALKYNLVQLLTEIKDTEKSFFEKLETLKKVHEALKAKSKILTKHQENIQIIFGNIDAIHGLHKEILRHILEINLDGPGISKKRAEFFLIFEKIVPLLPFYRPYVNNFTKAMSALKVLLESKKFGKILSNLQLNGSQLSLLLSAPLYRIPEYTEFMGRLEFFRFEDVLNFIPEQETKFNEVHQQLQKIASGVKESIAEEENLTKLVYIQKLLTTPRDYNFPPYRKYLREGVMRYKNERFFHEGYLFLFNDVLLITAHHFIHKGFKYVREINLTTSLIEPLAEEEENTKFHLLSLEGESLCEFDATTHQEMISWVSDISKAIDQYRVFRVPLKDLWIREKKKIPSFVKDCIDYLSKDLEVEGLFRVNSAVSTLKSFVLEIEYGKKVNFNQYGPIVVAGAFKQFFRELPEPLFHPSKFYQLLNVATLQNEQEQIKQLQTIVTSLNKPSRTLLSVLIPFLSKIAFYSEKNKMTIKNLSIIFAPLIVFPRDASITEAIYKNPSLSDHARDALEIFIANVNEIFSTKLEFKRNTPTKERILNRTKTLGHSKNLRELSLTHRNTFYSSSRSSGDSLDDNTKIEK